MNPFLQLAAEKQDSKNGAARKFLGPSYFDPTLVAYTYLPLALEWVSSCFGIQSNLVHC